MVETGSLNLLKAGTVTRVEGGSILVIAGTLTTGSLSNVATIGTIQNLNQGTVTVGNINTIGTLNVVEAGSLNLLKAGTITRLEGGSIVQTAGTLTTGTLQNLVSGSIVQVSGTLTTGSLSNVATIGTLTYGTIVQQWQPVNQVTSFGTLGTASGSLFGTLSGTSGAGTKHIVEGCSVVVQSGTADVRVLIGSAIQGGSILTAGAFPPGGGIARTFTPPIASGTNSELIYHFVGAGTAFITVQYWKAI